MKITFFERPFFWLGILLFGVLMALRAEAADFWLRTGLAAGAGASLALVLRGKPNPPPPA